MQCSGSLRRLYHIATWARFAFPCPLTKDHGEWVWVECGGEWKGESKEGEKKGRDWREEVEGKQKSEGTFQRKCGAKFVFTIGPEKSFCPLLSASRFFVPRRLLTFLPPRLPVFLSVTMVHARACKFVRGLEYTNNFFFSMVELQCYEIKT